MSYHRLFNLVKWLLIEVLRDAWSRGVLGAVVLGAITFLIGVPTQTAIPLAVVFGALIYEIRDSEHRNSRRLRCLEDQALLLRQLGAKAELPVMGGWAVEPDFARLILEELQQKPSLVVECGSGTSTVLIASILRSNGLGKLYSIEHDAQFADVVRARLEADGLSNWVDLHTAPLKELFVDGKRMTWYDLDFLPTIPDQEIDLLIVDGPPPIVPLARWPALMIMHSKLADDGCVLLDDGRRNSERRVTRRWASTYPDLRVYWIDTVKGTWKLVRSDDACESSVRTALRRLVRIVHPQPTGFGREAVRR